VRRGISWAIYLLCGSLGLVALAYPFLAPTTAGGAGIGERQDATLFAAALVGLALVALFIEVQGNTIDAKTMAILGVLIAVTSVLRFVEIAVPIPGGFSPIFGPIIIAGYVFGARFGFLMGSLTLLLSGLVTGGVGPWLPFQMFTAGWIGMSAGWLGQLLARSGKATERHVLALSLFGLAWGFGYGLVINLFFWPYAMGPSGSSWELGMPMIGAIRAYGAFYVATSLLWDAVRGFGNMLMVAMLGRPMIGALERFRRRFAFEVSDDA